jgi:hypothetical protein
MGAAQLVAEGEAVDVGQADVEEDEVGGRLREQGATRRGSALAVAR